ncbi:Unknown protein sequence [Pseudomonas amygdali pv. lachrymans]|uniref:Uncharacterized protein n=1 Tax=Pseudomonas amygdali pv. lachrymans TaxID=53707 RepID=A0ABR5KSV9_PSEAV|nr:Unknown protein sequence [Pseudomonas amygdali pv. lachrymans]
MVGICKRLVDRLEKLGHWRIRPRGFLEHPKVINDQSRGELVTSEIEEMFKERQARLKIGCLESFNQMS